MSLLLSPTVLAGTSAPHSVACGTGCARSTRAAQTLPSDAELERLHAVFGRIQIDNENIFNLKNPKDDNALFRLSDRLHRPTRRSLIR